MNKDKDGLAERASAPPGTRITRLPSLTGLRFLAALLVLFFHAALPLSNIRLFASDEVEGDFYALTAPAGGLGVTFFFVLSGFILTWSARASDTAAFFWRRRAAKIIPAYLVAWLLAMLLVAGSATELWRALSTFFMVQSWIPDLATNFAVNNPGWSLSTELFFYLCFPLLYFVAKRIPARHLKFWLAGVAFAIVVTPLVTYGVVPAGDAVVPNEPGHSANQFWFAYIFPPPRLLDFALGILAARAVMTGRWRDIGMAWSGLLLAVSYVAAAFVPLLYSLRVVCVIPTVLLIAAAAIADRDGRFTPFRNRVLTWLGEISYAFYLVHYIVLLYTRILFGDRMFSTPAGIAIIAAETVVSLLAAWALYAWVERPLTRRWSRPRRPTQRSTQGPTPQPSMAGVSSGVADPLPLPGRGVDHGLEQARE